MTAQKKQDSDLPPSCRTSGVRAVATDSEEHEHEHEPEEADTYVRRRNLTPDDWDPTIESAPVASKTYGPLLGELSRLLSSTLDYTAAIREVTDIIGNCLACGCIVDMLEPCGPVQLAHVPSRAPLARSEAIQPLVAQVVARGRPAAAAREPRDAPKTRSVAQRVREDLGADWLVSVPLTTEHGDVLGAMTMFGFSDRGVRISSELAGELGRRMAIAVENGRLYRNAIIAAREREHILGIVAHELKNPLGVILMGTAHLLESTSDAERGTGNTGRRELEAINRSARRMKKLVSDLLDLASIDAGKLSINPTTSDMSDVLRAAIREIAPSATAAGVDVLEDVSRNVPTAWIDGDRIAQVLVNLLSNAIKFSPRGGRVRVRASRGDHSEIVIAVEDSGRGIATEDIGRVFDPFWQATDTARLGSGMGLAICKSIVELSGGRIWAQSSVGVGTTVYFTIPALG
jgi:signal transduction histidine kinase